MDYLSWELERQRAALGALLGGGEARDGEAAPEGERRSPAELETARRDAAGRAGRYAGGGDDTAVPDSGAPGAWEAVQGDWEGSWGTEEGGGFRAGEGARVRALSRGEGPQRRTAALREAAREGTGPWTSHPGGSAAAPESPAELRAEAMEPPAEHAGETGAGEDAAKGSGGWEDAGSAAARAPRSTLVWGPSRFGRGGPWGGGGVSTALQAEDGAKALSLAVQRDARRYDGGFGLY